MGGKCTTPYDKKFIIIITNSKRTERRIHQGTKDQEKRMIKTMCSEKSKGAAPRKDQKDQSSSLSQGKKKKGNLVTHLTPDTITQEPRK